MEILELQKGIVYGPVKSRRLGRSLGINLMPSSFKICSLNCSYCQYGWTSALTNSGRRYEEFFPSVQEVTLALRDALMHNSFDYITFSGNGEPTLHPEFAKIVYLVREMKAFYRSEAKLAILSNSTTCNDEEIREALDAIDLPIMKLDVGNELMFRRLNHGVPPVTLQSIVEGLKSLRQYVIQTMFVKGVVDNSRDVEVSSWIDILKQLSPQTVQIYSLDRGSASNKIQKVEQKRLEQIAKMTQDITSLKVDVF